MPHEFSIALKGVWLMFGLFWLFSALRVKPALRIEGSLTRFTLYWLPLILAMLLLSPGDWLATSWLQAELLPHTNPIEWLGLALAVSGLLLACWSRYLLGRNWSLSVQLKQKHELIQQGPYRHVRHPIYSGLLLMFSGSAVMIGEWRGVLSLAIVFISFWYKLRREEQWLLQAFGSQYQTYMARSRALIPGIL